MATIDIHIEMIKEYIKRYYSTVEETNLEFYKPYLGLEKVSGTEFKLHILNADFIIPFGTWIIAKAHEKNVEITHASINNDSTYNQNIPVVKTITGAHVIQRTFKVNSGSYIHIMTTEDMGAEPKFIITNILKVGNPVKKQPNNIWMTNSTTANLSGTATITSDIFTMR